MIKHVYLKWLHSLSKQHGKKKKKKKSHPAGNGKNSLKNIPQKQTISTKNQGKKVTPQHQLSFDGDYQRPGLKKYTRESKIFKQHWKTQFLGKLMQTNA